MRSPLETGRYWDESLSPVTGCTPAGAGCDHCWARAMVARFGHLHARADDDGGPIPQPYGETMLHPSCLDKLARWRKPRRVAMSWLGDLFHYTVSTDYIDSVIRAMRLARQHRYLVLTKRPEAMASFLRDYPAAGNVAWWGASAWDQASLDRALASRSRIACVWRCWLSMEPLLGPVTLPRGVGVDWVVVGAETGPKARPCELTWVASVVQQCQVAGVPVWVKAPPSRGTWAGTQFERGDWPREMPAGLRLPGEEW